MLLLALRVPRPVLAAACAAGTAYCFHALRVVQEADLRPTDDFRLDGRGGGLLAGCTLALLLSRRRSALLPTGLRRGRAARCCSAWTPTAVLVEPVPLQTTVPVAVVATVLLLVGLLAGAPGPVAALLATPPVAYLGRISYSLYLWHYVFFRAFEAARGPAARARAVPRGGAGARRGRDVVRGDRAAAGALEREAAAPLSTVGA